MNSKEYNEKVKAYEGHCIDEKVAFIELMREKPWLNTGDNKMRYIIYLEDYLDYRYNKSIELLNK